MMMKKELYIPQNDVEYSSRYIDVDEIRVRVTPYGDSIKFRYVHGGFEGTNVKFSLCMPEKEMCEGRIYNYLNPSPAYDEEMQALPLVGEEDQISFCLINKSCFLESNMGSVQASVPMSDPTVVWKSSAQVMLFAKEIVKEHCGVDKVYGYVHGGSGGGYKTMACIENTDGVFDGALPYVIGSPVSLPNTLSMHVLGQRVLRNAFRKFYSSIDAGGSGNIYDELNEVESAALKELTIMGFPPSAWFYEARGVIKGDLLGVVAPVVRMTDPAYFEDFWTKEGYEGKDDVYYAQRDRLVFDGKVKGVHLPESGETEISKTGVDSAWKKGFAYAKEAYIELEKLPEGDDLYLGGTHIVITSGEATGTVFSLERMERDENGGGKLFVGMTFGMTDITTPLSKVASGDFVHLDNSDYIATQYYYRHQVPDDRSFKAWEQFRGEDGNILLPQRGFIMGYGFTGTGTIQDGDIHCKTINLQSLMDESTCPWCADWYRKKVAENGKLDMYRTYYMERTMHGDYDCPQTNLNVSYIGAKRQLLLDLAKWVEEGVEPLPSTEYEMIDNQPKLPENAKIRRGIQPTIEFTANGGELARVKAGEPVKIVVKTEVPDGAGKITDIAVDLYDRDITEKRVEFEKQLEINADGGAEFVESFYEKGERFVSVMVKSQRNGDNKDLYTKVKNLARVKVIVE